MNNLNVDALPEAAKKELLNFYEYLIFKYVQKLDSVRETNTPQNASLDAFHRFKKLRDRLNPVVDKSVDIDKLINEGNRVETCQAGKATMGCGAFLSKIFSI